MELIKIFKLIKNTNSINKKLDLASKYFTKFHHDLFEVCFSDLKLNLSKKSIIKALNLNKQEVNKYEDLGEYIENNLNKFKNIFIEQSDINIKTIQKILLNYSGNKLLIKFKNIFYSIKDEYKSWYVRAILRDMRIGINFKLYNKIRIKQGLKPLEQFYVKLANPIDLSLLQYNKKIIYPILCESKLDGIRCILYKKNNLIKLYSRSGKDISEQFPEIIEKANLLKNNVILDGEIISSDFNTLQNRLGRKKENLNYDPSIRYYLFDILKLKDNNLKNLEQYKRLNYLINFNLKNKFIFKQVNFKIVNNYNELYNFYLKNIKEGFEGIMIKNLNSKYENNRNNWFKLKPVKEADLKIIDCKYGNGKNKNYISSLICIDEHKNKVKIGSGISDKDKSILTKLYKENKLIGMTVEIQYQEKTKNSYRFPRFVRLRYDK